MLATYSSNCAAGCTRCNWGKVKLHNPEEEILRLVSGWFWKKSNCTTLKRKFSGWFWKKSICTMCSLTFPAGQDPTKVGKKKGPKIGSFLKY
jgi:hypothetical protein